MSFIKLPPKRKEKINMYRVPKKDCPPPSTDKTAKKIIKQTISDYYNTK